MPKVSRAEEQGKIASEARWASLGRMIADYSNSGTSIAELVRLAVQWRETEQEQADRQVLFAALVRQIGDAAKVGRDYTNQVKRMMEIRRRELGNCITQDELETSQSLNQRPA